MTKSVKTKGNKYRFPFFIFIFLVVAYLGYLFFKPEEDKNTINLLYNTSFTLAEDETSELIYNIDSLTMSKIQENFNRFPLYKYIIHDNYDLYVLMSIETRKDSITNKQIKAFSNAINKNAIVSYYRTKKNKEFVTLAVSKDSLITLKKSLLHERFKENN